MVFTRHALEVQIRNPTNQNKKLSMFWNSMGPLRGASQHHLQDSHLRTFSSIRASSHYRTVTTWTAVVFTLHDKTSCHSSTHTTQYNVDEVHKLEAVLTNSNKKNIFSHNFMQVIKRFLRLYHRDCCGWISSTLSLHRTDAHPARSWGDNIK